MAPNAMKSFLQTLFGQRLRPGDRVRVSGGHETAPRWLNGKEAYFGSFLGFIPGQSSEPAAIIQLDEPVVFGDITGSFLIMELRFVGARWAHHETVHLELCESLPPNKGSRERLSRGYSVHRSDGQ